MSLLLATTAAIPFDVHQQTIAVPSFDVHENANNVYGRVPSPKTNGTGVVFLGAFDSAAACAKACTGTLGAATTASDSGCTSYTYHTAGFDDPDWRRQCYGITDGAWSPHGDEAVVSGQSDPTRTRTPCTTAADCSHNGKCAADGACDCDAAWMGIGCAQLRTRATPGGAGLASVASEQRVSSWGGSVLWDAASKRWHMWAAEMQEHCGIRVWLTNSAIRHASTDDLSQPFVAHELVWPVFAHEPTVARAPTGEVVMFFTSTCPNATHCSIPCTGKLCHGGANGTTPFDHPLPGKCPNDQHCTLASTLSSYMAYATTPDGPWSEPALLPAPFTGDTNLAPVILSDGSLVGLGRPPYRWKASHWRDVSSYKIDEVSGLPGGEDPFVFLQHNDESILHALFHGGGWSDPHGYHAASSDGGATWRVVNGADGSPIQAYGSQLVAPSDAAGGASLSRRERPHLAVDTNGIVRAITNGATPAWPCSEPNVCPDDYCFTSLELVGARD